MTVSARRVGRWDVAVALCLALLFAALSVRAVSGDRWSDWAFGDALTLLSLRQWEENGWLANRLLMLPQGYAAPVRHLDDPDLRHHAHGTSRGSSPRVGPRLWYTHYPAGYLVPHALLTRLGLGSMAALRLLALTLSVAALALMYLVFKRLSSAPAAFVAAVFYALSPAFLGYADSLANQPLDDLLRFGFLLAVVLSTRAGEARARRTALIAAWGIEFVLSLSSYDSVFFVYLWLVGWDLLETRRPHWRRWLVFAAAPVSAFGLCFLQNVWYLGWTDAARDIADAFLMKSPADAATRFVGSSGGTAIGRALAVILERVFVRPWLLPALLVLYGLRRRVFADGGHGRTPSPGVLALLFLCGAIFPIVLPQSVWMPYEARQLVPFAALLAGGLTVAVAGDIAALRGAWRARLATGRGAGAVLTVVTASMTLIVFFAGWAASLKATLERHPTYAIPVDGRSVRLARELSSLSTEHDTVFFDLNGFGLYFSPVEAPGYPQVNPVLEYYAGMRPILAFSAASLVAPDVEILARRAPRRFSPVLVSSSYEGLRAVVEELGRRGLLLRAPEPPRRVQQVFVLDLTMAMRW